MAVLAQVNNTTVSYTFGNVRYSLMLNKVNSVFTGNIIMQRCQNAAGIYTDDTRPDSRVIVALPGTGAVATAMAPVYTLLTSEIDGVVAGIATVLGVTGYTDYRLNLMSRIGNDGTLDVTVSLNFFMPSAITGVPSSWLAKNVPSLNAFMAANPSPAGAIGAVWNGLDSALNSVNATAKLI